MNVLVISAHPDDETLGCGGALLKHKHQGAEIDWIILSRGLETDWPADVLALRPPEIEEVGTAFGFRHVIQRDFPAARIDTVPQFELMAALREDIRQCLPQVVYVVHPGDVNSDHRSVFNAVMAVLKPFHCAALGVSRVLAYETFSSTDQAASIGQPVFIPNIYCDISPWLERKLEIMGLYRSQLQDYPFPRDLESIRALSRMRGATIGVEYAEVFAMVSEFC